MSPATPATTSKRELTVRAVLLGMALGSVLCLSNLYVFFKTGWSLGVTLTACILAFAIVQSLHKLRLTNTPLSMLENNALTTVASGAGYMTGGGNMAAFGALLMVTTARPETLPMMLWFAVIAALGVFAAVPIKEQLIDKEQLTFPTGTATAETLRSIHGEGQATAHSSGAALWLGYAAAAGALVAFFRDVKGRFMPFTLPGTIELPGTLLGRPLKDFTIALKMEVVLLGAGALMSFRTAWSMLLGGALTYGVWAPSLVEGGQLSAPSYKAIVGLTVWPSAALLVASGLTAFAFDGRSVLRTLTSLPRMLLDRSATAADNNDPQKPPAWWFPAGFLVLGPVVVVLMSLLFHIPMWAGAIAVPLAVLMGFVAARVTGETDVTPTKALGPVTQLLFGALVPGNLAGNIMSANVTGGIGLHAADLLTTMKTGYLLGASPRAQVKAQLFGVLAGAAVIVPAFWLIIPDPSALGSEAWPAPSCLVWAGVSKGLAGGMSSLPAGTATTALIAGVLGVVLAIIEKLAPARLRAFVPSPAGLGIAMVIPCSNAMAMCAGGVLAEIARRRSKTAEARTVQIASGLIAGESLMGIAIALLIAVGVLGK